MKNFWYAIATLLVIFASDAALANCCPEGWYGAGNCSSCTGGTNSCNPGTETVCCNDGQRGQASECK